MALAAPTISIAQALPSNLVGLNLGEIQASSYLNQPFRGVIPFLFTSIENSNKLSVRLAPSSVFARIGAEKLPILDDLHFQIVTQVNKPVILIGSNRPIQLPFLNFVLEVEGPDGVVYQDYTVLLDPPNYQDSAVQTEVVLSDSVLDRKQPSPVTGDNLTLTKFASPDTSSSKSLKYKVKSGDSLSVIAQRQYRNGVSVNTMAQGIYKKNPSAFIRGDINKIRKGAVLILPTTEELKGFQFAHSTTNATASVDYAKPVEAGESYKVKSGDSLFKITRQFVAKDVSFTKMMNAIYTANPDAFSRKSKSLLKAGAVLQIPSANDVLDIKQQVVSTASDTIEQEIIADKKTVQAPEILDDLSLSTSSESNNAKNITSGIEKTAALKKDEYRVKEGDTLTTITKAAGHKEASFTKMMKAIYTENPGAFDKNNLIKPIAGSVIKIPALEGIESVPKDVSEIAETGKMNTSVDSVTDKETKQSTETTANSGLEKRIRELRAELGQAKTGLSDLKVNLENKDSLINEKDSELINLKSALLKLKIDQRIVDPGDSATVNNLYGEATKTKPEIAAISEPVATISGADKTSEALNEELKNYITSYFDASSAKDLTYMSLALILGVILIRYRREIYSYTSINYDQPGYYPAPDAEKYQLQEKNITFQDSIMDFDPISNDNNSPELFDDHKSHDDAAEFVETDESVESVEADESVETVEADESVDQEESEEITHCEHLITELFDDLSTNSEPVIGNTEWDSIEKVCDEYIDKIKEEESVTLSESVDSDQKNSVTDFEEMMNDLLENLTEVEGSSSDAENPSGLPELIDDETPERKETA
jgi:FimV-like protein